MGSSATVARSPDRGRAFAGSGRTLGLRSRVGAERAVAVAGGGVTAADPAPNSAKERSDTRLTVLVSPMKGPKWWNVLM